MDAVELVGLWRGGLRESVHRGHAVVCDAQGGVVQVWGNADVAILPRSSSKMIQALPLIESGAADAAGLGPEELALACASHKGALMHTARVRRWLAGLGCTGDDLRCGAHMPDDPEAHRGLLCSDTAPDQVHNNCSGKHAGFVTLARHLRAGPEYNDPDHPVQQAIRTVWAELTGETSPGFGIDGCSAPNHITSLRGLARAMAGFAAARPDGDGRARAQARLVAAMMAHPALISGEGQPCTELMRALDGQGAVKTGAEGVYVAILPGPGLGVALKIEDGAGRAAACAIAAILARLGALDPAHPVMGRLAGPIRNWRGLTTGEMRALI